MLHNYKLIFSFLGFSANLFKIESTDGVMSLYICKRVKPFNLFSDVEFLK